MKIISFTKVANDCEVIESFIRYYAQIVDKMLFVSSCCIDNTSLIIRNMIKEGFNIELIEEADISFEERYMDNKYLRMIAREGEYDLILPIDTDEFITGDDNPRHILERLSLDKVYLVNWFNYVMTEKDNMSEAFIPKRQRYVLSGAESNDVKKAIIPSRMITEKNVVTVAGRHSITGEGIEVESLDNLYLAHYPSTSKDQYLLRIYDCAIRNIIRTDLGDNEGSHKRIQYAMLQAGNDVYDVAGKYGYVANDESISSLEEKPLYLDCFKKEDLIIKYPELAKTNMIQGLIRIGQLMAVKAYILEREKFIQENNKRVLIYGTGNEAKVMLNGISEGLINVMAYVDSDTTKQFGMYNRKLVIPPDFCRFFKYDKIIISSNRFYDEMLQTLTDLGIKHEKISNVGWLFDLMKEVRDE